MACFLRNIVATVNLDCRLDLKTIALHARNAEYNPKVLTELALATVRDANLVNVAICGRHHADPRAQNDGSYLCIWQNGRYWRQVRR